MQPHPPSRTSALFKDTFIKQTKTANVAKYSLFECYTIYRLLLGAAVLLSLSAYISVALDYQ